MGTTNLSVSKIRPYGGGLQELLSEVAKFHQREFPTCLLEILSPQRAPDGLFFEDLRASLEVGETPAWLSPATQERGDKELTMVALPMREPTPYSAGYGAPGLVVLGLVENDPFASTLIAHELYHALLDLPHTDGLEGPEDCDSVMGEEGRFSPLMTTYVCPQQVQLCLTTREAQEAVERGDFEQALKLDPTYFAICPMVLQDCARKGMLEYPLGLLRAWWLHGQSPEAATHYLELLLNTGWVDEAKDILQDTLGYFEAANTHLYAARACVAAHQYQLGVEELKMSLTLAPDCLPALGALGWCYHRLGQERLARKFYLKALEQSPDWQLVQARLAWLDGESYVAPSAEPDLLYVQARCSSESEAIELLQGVEDQACLHYLGWLLIKAGRTTEAQDAFEAAADFNRLNLEGSASRAWLSYLKKGNPAQRAAEVVLQVWPQEASCLYLRGL